ncbi:MAG: Uncharacterised protein [Cryomorphaceae bacterium]|nr:MAG: Uncharacterised protein [Cryomorphaceae bacterium]
MGAEEKKGKFGIVVAVLAIGVIALGVLLYLRSEANHELEMEKQSLTIELSGMKEDLLLQVGENDSLNAYIQYETTRLSSVIDSINAVNVQNKKSLTNYRYRLSSMKKQNAELVARLDSSNEAYTMLKLREQAVADSLNAAMDANANLSGQNNALSATVEKGERLVIATATTQAVRVTASGKERKTRRAKRTNRINACLTLAKNRIAPAGTRTLYVKIIDPNGKPVDAPEANMAVVGGERSGYNGEAQVDFQGEAVEVCVAANRAVDAPVELAAGIYTIAVYTDAYLVGTAALELK